MAKYIDADALFNETEHLACYDNRDRDAFEDLILSMPAADVEPVKHGEWRGSKCSVCGAQIATDAAFDYLDESDQNFCYSCGAKMDGGSE